MKRFNFTLAIAIISAIFFCEFYDPSKLKVEVEAILASISMLLNLGAALIMFMKDENKKENKQ